MDLREIIKIIAARSFHSSSHLYIICVLCVASDFSVWIRTLLNFNIWNQHQIIYRQRIPDFFFFSLVRFNFGLLLYFFAEIVLFILYHFILSFLCSMPTPIKLSFRFRKMFCGMDGKHTTTTTTVPWITSCTRAKIYTFNLRNT